MATAIGHLLAAVEGATARRPAAPAMRRRPPCRVLWWAGLCAALMSTAVPPARSAGAIPVPTAQQVIDRVLATARGMNLSRADIVIKFRVKEPVTAPPLCVFDGTLHISERLALAMKRWTRTPLCWLIERLVLERLFRDRDRANALLPQFRFEVIGEKLVDGRHYYLVTGRALSRGTDPSWMVGWVDYDRGLIVDGGARYTWGEVDSVQEYTLVSGQWVPVHQYLSVPRFDASLEISYSGFRFGSGP